MNIKDFIVPLVLALITTWAIQYFFFSKRQTGPTTSGVVSGQGFVAPKTKQEVKPINVEIDFFDAKRPKPPVTTVIRTKYAELVFSTDGASLERLTFERQTNGHTRTITTIFPVTDVEREKRAFLVALNEKTPYFYDLIEKKESEFTIDLTYESKVDQGTVRKTFVIYKDIYKIDIKLTLIPKLGSSMEARIFYPSPFMPEIAEYDVISAVVNDESGSIKKISRNKLDLNQGWFVPTIFGAEDKYFVNTLVADQQQFAQRAYFNTTGKNGLVSILESESVDKETTWNLSFYCGPKEESALVAVNPSLRQVMDYSGILAPISRFLLGILKFLFSYVHNYGLAIIILTIMIKLLLLPFSLKGEKSMKKRLEFQKKLNYIQQRYKKEPEVLARERAELIKKHGMGGMFGGCLPLLLQMPLFFALNRALSSSIELYEAPFLWIPNLSAHDPYYVLPIIVTGAMLFQAAMTDPKQRLQIAAVALIFGAITANLSAGLALYLAVNTVLTVTQTSLQKTFAKA